MQSAVDGPVINIDEFRHAIERMDPVHYLGSTYFEHWVESILEGCIAKRSVHGRGLRSAARGFSLVTHSPTGDSRREVPLEVARPAPISPRTPVRAALQCWRRGSHEEYPARWSHPAGALCPGQAGTHRGAPGLLRLSRHERPRPWRMPATPLQRPIRSSGVVGRGCGAKDERLHRPLRELPAGGGAVASGQVPPDGCALHRVSRASAGIVAARKGTPGTGRRRPRDRALRQRHRAVAGREDVRAGMAGRALQDAADD